MCHMHQIKGSPVIQGPPAHAYHWLLQIKEVRLVHDRLYDVGPRFDLDQGFQNVPNSVATSFRKGQAHSGLQMAEEEYAMTKVRTRRVDKGVLSAEAFADWHREHLGGAIPSSPANELQDLSKGSHRYPKLKPYTPQEIQRSDMSPN